MSDLTKKRAEFDKVRRELMDLEEQEKINNKYPVMKKREGTYEKYRNCYSCPDGDKDYWWLYHRIVEVRPNGELIVDRIQIDKNGQLEVHARKVESWLYGHPWQSATEAEWVEVVNQAQGILRMLRT